MQSAPTRCLKSFSGSLLVLSFASVFLMVGGACQPALAQHTVEGVVTEAETGEPLPGVNIRVQDEGTGTATDDEGAFELEVASSDQTLVFSFVGYQTQVVPLEGRSFLEIEMEVQPLSGEEVVVVGYGEEQRRDLTGSVSSVPRQDLVEQGNYSIGDALQGEAPGVEVIADGYEPGEGSTIRIRGRRSINASNDPLIVVDGVPIAGGLEDISPSSVESVEVLKDASATAIYGSRGANGVVLITTRRGQEGETKINFSSEIGAQRISNKLDLMDADRYIELQRDAARQQGTYTSDEELFTDWELEGIERGVDTDWQDVAFDTGLQQNYSLSIRGGTEETQYAFSGDVIRHQAILDNNDYNRYLGRVNIDQEVFSALQVGLSMQASFSRTHRGANYRNLFLNSPIDWPGRAQKGLEGDLAVGENFPLLATEREFHIDRRDRTQLIANTYAELDLLDGLSYRANFAPDLAFSKRGYHSVQNSNASMSQARTTNLLFENILDYERDFGERHSLSSTALYSLQTNRRVGSSISVRDLPYESQRYYNLGTAEETSSRDSNLEEWTLESYMLRLNYDFLGRYLLTATGRVDGSSRLAEGNKYGLFPSMAVAWRISDEPFFQDQEFLTSLKLRVSYGDVGNTGIDPYQTKGRLNQVGYAFGDESVFGFENSELSNKELRWERTRELNLGLDFGLFNQRISGSINAYRQKTTDLLLRRQLPPTSGYGGTLQNVGATENIGLEANLSTVNIDTDPGRRSGLRWTTDVNFSTNRNEIVSLYGGTEDDPGNEWFIGRPINVHYDYDYVGIWQDEEEAARFGQEPGSIKVRDVNGDGEIGQEDRVILGSAQPSWIGSFRSRVAYRGFDFSFTVYTEQGRTIQSEAGGTSLGGMLNLRRGYNYNSRDVDYWTPDDPSAKYPRPRVRGRDFSTPLSYFDGSFVRVRNVNLGYRLSPSLLNGIGLRSARVYTAVDNPLVFTDFPGLDPEGARNHDMPNYRNLRIGINLGF